MATPTRPCPYCGAAVLMNAAACGTCGRPMPAAPGGPPAGGGGPAKTMFGYAAPVRAGAPPPGPPAPAPARPPGPPPAQPGFPPGPPQHQAPPQQPGFPPQQPGFPPQQPGFPPQQPGFPPQQPPQFGGPPQQPGFPPQPQHQPPPQFGGPPQQPGFPPQQPGFPPQQPPQFGGPPQQPGFPPQHQPPPQFGGPPQGQHGQFGGPPQQPGFPPPPQHQPPPPQFGGPPQQPPPYGAPQGHPPAPGAPGAYGAPPQPYGQPPQPGFPPPPAQGYPPPGANPYAAPVADLPGPLDNIARALPGSAPGTIFGVPLAKLRDPDLQKKALFLLGAALIISIFVPASFSPFAFAFKGNAFKGLVWPLLAGGSYLLVAAAPPHIKQKVPPVVLEWLPFGVSYAGIMIVGTGAVSGFGPMIGKLPGGGSELGALNGIIAAASTFYALAMATLVFGLLARLQNPQDQVARIIMAVGAGMLIFPLIDLFGALFKFSFFGESVPILGIHNQLFFLVVLVGILTLLYLVPPKKLPPALQAIDSLAPLVAAVLLLWLPLQVLLLHLSALLDMDDEFKATTVILSLARSLLALLAYFGVLMLTAPAAYDSFMAMFKKGQGGQPPAPPPPPGGGYPPPGGGYPPPGGGYPPPGGGYPPQQGGGWPQQ